MFFVMPAVVESLIHNQGLSISKAWRVAFVAVPFVLIVSVAFMCLIFGDDCPQGDWKDRYLPNQSSDSSSCDSMLEKGDENSLEQTNLPTAVSKEGVILVSVESQSTLMQESKWITNDDVEDKGSPYWYAAISPQTMLAALPYACTFGHELAVESIISAWYIQRSAIDGGVKWTEVTSGM